MGRSKPRMFQTSAKTKRSYRAMSKFLGGAAKSAAKTGKQVHKITVRNRKLRQAEAARKQKGTFLGCMPFTAWIVRSGAGWGCLTWVAFIFFVSVFWFIWLPIDLIIGIVKYKGIKK